WLTTPVVMLYPYSTSPDHPTKPACEASASEAGTVARGGKSAYNPYIMWQDVRYALRTIRRAPNFAVVAALTLSLGIGRTAAAFTFLNEVLLRPVPAAADAGRLVQLRRKPPRETKTAGFTASGYATYVSRARSFSGLLAYRDTDVNLSAGGRPERTSAAMV